MVTAPVVWSKSVAPEVAVSTVTSGQSEADPVRITSGSPLASNDTWRHGVGSSQLSTSSRKTLTTTVPASTGLWSSVPVMVVPPPPMVRSSPLTVWEL